MTLRTRPGAALLGLTVGAAMALSACGQVPRQAAPRPESVTSTAPTTAPTASANASSTSTPSTGPTSGPSATPDRSGPSVDAPTQPSTKPRAAPKQPPVRPAVVMKSGAKGDQVRGLQARLKQLGWFAGDVTGVYGSITTTAVRGFQGKRGLPETGEVDRKTWDRLVGMTKTPTKDQLLNRSPKSTGTTKGLDPRCLSGRVMCISKRNNTITWVVDGAAKLRMDVRFGADETPTRNGSFRVFRKTVNGVSTLYHTRMPWAMTFSGGQAVHYSPDFAARGYNGASHGCVNVRDHDGVKWLWHQVRLGDKVVVYS